VVKYAGLSSQSEFVPIAVESHGPINRDALQFLSVLGSWRLVETTGDVRASSFLFQRIFVVVQFLWVWCRSAFSLLHNVADEVLVRFMVRVRVRIAHTVTLTQLRSRVRALLLHQTRFVRVTTRFCIKIRKLAHNSANTRPVLLGLLQGFV